MPQMMPLYWSFMIIYSIIMLLIISLFIYFFYFPTLPLSPLTSLTPPIKQKNKWNWSW